MCCGDADECSNASLSFFSFFFIFLEGAARSCDADECRDASLSLSLYLSFKQLPLLFFELSVSLFFLKVLLAAVDLSCAEEMLTIVAMLSVSKACQQLVKHVSS